MQQVGSLSALFNSILLEPDASNQIPENFSDAHNDIENDLIDWASNFGQPMAAFDSSRQATPISPRERSRSPFLSVTPPESNPSTEAPAASPGDDEMVCY